MTNDEILQAAKEAGFVPNRSYTNIPVTGYATHDLSDQIKAFAAIIEKRTIERCAIPDQAMQAIQEACRSAMHYTAAARIPECGEFGAIAQNLSFALQEIAAIRKLGEKE